MNRPEIQLSAIRWRFPSPSVRRLANGLTIWHFPLPGQHIAAVELLQPIRLTDEPRSREGIATIALHAIDESTRSHPHMQELLDLSGSAIHAGARFYSTRFGALLPARRLSRFLPMLAEILTEPAYLPADVALHIEAQCAEYRTRVNAPAAAAAWAFRAALHGRDQRQGRPAAGSPETLGAISRDDVEAWHAQQFSPSGSTLIVAGDIAEPDFSALEAWSGEAARSPIRPPRSQPGQVVIVDVPGAVQATIHVGVRSICRSDPRWASVQLAGHVLAGGFASRLNLELRERLGYTYGVSGGVTPDACGSVIQISTSTGTEVAGDALTRILDAVRLDEPISAAELTAAQAYRVGIAPLANETAADIAGQALTLCESGMECEFVNAHLAALQAVDPESASGAWRGLVHGDALVVAVAGDAAALAHQLAEFNPAVVELA